MILEKMLPARLPPALFYLSGLAKRPEPGAQATAPAMLVITLIMMLIMFASGRYLSFAIGASALMGTA